MRRGTNCRVAEARQTAEWAAPAGCIFAAGQNAGLAAAGPHYRPIGRRDHAQGAAGSLPSRLQGPSFHRLPSPAQPAGRSAALTMQPWGHPPPGWGPPPYGEQGRRSDEHASALGVPGAPAGAGVQAHMLHQPMGRTAGPCTSCRCRRRRPLPRRLLSVCRAANGLSAAHDAGHASPDGHAASHAWGARHGAHRAPGRAAADDARAAAAG